MNKQRKVIAAGCFLIVLFLTLFAFVCCMPKMSLIIPQKFREHGRSTSLIMADDHKIAKLLNQQAEEGLDLAHKEYARMLYLTAYRLLGNHEDASF